MQPGWRDKHEVQRFRLFVLVHFDTSCHVIMLISYDHVTQCNKPEQKVEFETGQCSH